MEMTAFLEFWIQGEPIELAVEVEYDPDWPITIESARIVQKNHEQCVYNILTIDQKERLQLQAMDHMQVESERAEAAMLDAADARMELAREIQQDEINSRERQRRAGR